MVGSSERRERLGGLSPAKQALFERWQHGSVNAVASSIGARPADADVRLSPSQQGIWLVEQLHGATPLYNLPVAFRLRGSIQETALQRALALVFERHEALRMQICSDSSGPRLEQAPDGCTPFEVVDLRPGLGAGGLSEALDFAASIAQEPFELTGGPLVRVRLLRLDTDDHLLVAVVHHIVADGWSLGVLVTELQVVYNAIVEGREPVLPALLVQYADFVYWESERELAEPDRRKADLDYWIEAFDPLPAILELPVDRPRPPLRDVDGQVLRFRLGEELVRAARAFAGERNVTLYCVLLSAFDVVMHRFTGQDDIVVGAPTANRRRIEAEPLIGLFVNLLALRVRVAAHDTFEDLLIKVRTVVHGGFAHQDLPFEQLVEAVQPSRDPRHTPLVQAVFALQNTPLPPLDLAGLRADRLPIHTGTAKWDVGFFLTPDGDAIDVEVEYAATIFEENTVAALCEAFEVVLSAGLGEPATPVAVLPLMQAEERIRAVIHDNDTAEDLHGRPGVLAGFAEQVERNGSATAVRFGTARLTYAELDDVASLVAHELLQRGCSRGDRVGVCVDRALVAAALPFGIWRAGAVYVPVDPDQPPERLTRMLDDAAPTIILVDAAGKRCLSARVQTGSVVIDIADLLPRSVPTHVPSMAKPMDGEAAYVIFTSGSTGRPKGVEIGHGALRNLVHAFADNASLTTSDVLLAAVPLAFDLSVADLVMPLVYGASIVMAPTSVVRDGAQLAAAIDEHDVTLAQATTTMWRLLIRSGWRGRDGLRAYAGGEPIPRDLATEMATRCHAFRRGYGPTETTIWTTGEDAVVDDTSPAILPIPGRQWANVRRYVLDEALEPVPIGVPGEIYLAGAQLANGYLDRPELTASRFLPDPFTDRPGARMYASGDIVRRRPDGDLDVVGRADHQVKVNGHRIELGEIEAALHSHPSVADAAVVAFADTSGGTRLAAYVVPHPSGLAIDEAGPDWTEVWASSYAGLEAYDDPWHAFHTWVSSYTGRPIDADQMAAWADEAALRVRALDPGHCLEVGCGSGLLLFRLAAHCERYIGLDPATPAVDYARSHLDLLGMHASRVTLVEGTAADADGYLAGVDTVVVNSVVQYLPSVRDLVDLIHRCAAGMAPGGRIMLGDIRNLDLVDELHRDIARHALGEGADDAEIDAAVTRIGDADAELVVSPDLFHAIGDQEPRIAAIEVIPKALQFDNELSRFRFDVVLYLDTPPACPLADLVLRDGVPPGRVRAQYRELAPGRLHPQRSLAHLATDPAATAARRALPGRLLRHLAERLPSYMLPIAMMVLEELPLSPNRKLDRSALPAPDYVRRSPSPREPLRTPTERKVSQIWGEILGLNEIWADDDFFGLGGQSLLANQVVANIRADLDVDLPLAVLFEHPTVRGLCQWIDVEGRSAERKVAGPPLTANRFRRQAPLSPSQERLWFLEQVGLSGAAYNMPGAFRVTGPLDRAAFERAVRRLVERQWALRTTIASEGGVPRQVVLEPAPSILSFDDLRAAPEGAAAALAAVIDEEPWQPFDLESGPLARVRLLRLAENDHALIVTLHHLIADGWSLAVLAREFGVLYAVETGASLKPPAPLDVSFLDYAAWCRQCQDSGAFADQLEYWRRTLGDHPPVLELPVDRPRPAVPGSRAGTVRFELPHEVVEAVREVARTTRATPFMVLLAAFHLQLARLTGQSDVVVGTPVANRQDPSVRDVIGMFINSIALRVKVNEQATFQDLVNQTRTVCIDSYANQDVPFEEVVDAVKPERTLRHPPLFQVLFALQNMERVSLDLVGLKVRPIGMAVGGAKFDLSMLLSETLGGFDGLLEYRCDLFDATTANGLAEGFVGLLAAALKQPTVPMLDVGPVGDKGAAVVVGPAPAADQLDVVAALRERAQIHPERVALRCGADILTYADLDRQAEAVAAKVRLLGASDGDRIGVCFERNADLVVAIHGVLRAGATYVPLDPTHPAERLRLIREAADAVLILEQPQGDATQTIHKSVEEGPSPNSLAYLMFTSGSTGVPKGVAVSHKALTNFVSAMATRPGLGPSDRLLAVTTPSFDISILELVAPFALGAEVVLATTSEVGDPVQLRRLLEEHQITVMQATPTTWRMLDETGWTAGSELRVLIGGEGVPSDLARRLAKTAKAVWNMYGPTEATIWAGARQIKEDDPVPPSGTESVGGPLPGLSFHVLDRWGRAVPVGSTGELSISGIGLAQGYWRRPDLTADRFVPIQVPSARGDRTYRTGDLCRMRADGTIEFLGRIDDQVKLRGFRIELGEVEGCLRRLDGVSDAAVVLHRGGAAGDQIVAYLVAGAAAGPVDDVIRAGLRKILPEYMVPGAFVWLDQLPLNSNGKVDRGALAARGRVPSGRQRESAWSNAERSVAAVWTAILGHDDFGPDANFFDVGGHSLAAVRVLEALKAQGHDSVGLIDLFEHVTPRAQAKFLGSGETLSETLGAFRNRASQRRSARQRGRG